MMSVCQAIVRGYEPVQLIGGIILSDRQWPSPTPRSPTRNGQDRRAPATAA